MRLVLHQKLLAFLHILVEERSADVTTQAVADVDENSVIGFVKSSVLTWLQRELERYFGAAGWKATRTTYVTGHVQ